MRNPDFHFEDIAKIRAMKRSGRWSNAQIARYMGYSEEHIASVRACDSRLGRPRTEVNLADPIDDSDHQRFRKDTAESTRRLAQALAGMGR